MTTTNECVFCTMAQDPMHSAPVYRDERVFAVKDINPKAPVHMLIVPNMHIASLAYVGPGQVPIMGHMFVVAEEIARREGVALSGYGWSSTRAMTLVRRSSTPTCTYLVARSWEPWVRAGWPIFSNGFRVDWSLCRQDCNRTSTVCGMLSWN